MKIVKQKLIAQGFYCRTCGEFKSKKNTKFVYIDIESNAYYCFSHRSGENLG